MSIHLYEVGFYWVKNVSGDKGLGGRYEMKELDCSGIAKEMGTYTQKLNIRRNFPSIRKSVSVGTVSTRKKNIKDKW